MRRDIGHEPGHPAGPPPAAGPTAAAVPAIEGRLLARNTLLNMLGHGVPMVVALVAVPLLVRGLGADRFGILAIAWTLLNYLGELGFGTTTTKFAAEALGAGDELRLAPIVWTTAAIQAGFGLLEGAALWAATPLLAGRVLNIPTDLVAEGVVCLYLLAAALPLIGVARSFRGLLEAAQRFDLVTAVRIPATMANYLLPLVGIALGWRLPGIFGLVLGSRIAVAATYFLICRALFPVLRSRPALGADGGRAMLGFGGWVTVSTVISPVLVYLDRFVLGAIVSIGAVAYYAAPYEAVARMLLIPASVVSTLFPAFSHLIGQAQWDRVGRLAARASKIVIVVLGPPVIGLVIGASDVLSIWLGADFAAESAVALQLLAIGLLFNAAAYIPYSLLHGAGRPDVPARFHLVELPVQLLVAWLLVREWGVTGAAAAWSIRVSVDALLLYGAAVRLGKLPWRSLIAERVPQIAAIVPAAAWLGALAIGSVAASGPRLAWIGAAVAVSAVLAWRFGLGLDERRRIAGMIATRQPKTT